MALEDRCSPQSAPSPPGIPHSPQNTSTSSNTQQIVVDTMTSAAMHQEMALSVSQHSDHFAPNVTAVKQERMDEDEIDCENSHNEPSPQSAFTFSISNILSDNFGKVRKSSNIKQSRDSLFRPYATTAQDINEDERQHFTTHPMGHIHPANIASNMYKSGNSATFDTRGNHISHFRLTAAEAIDYSRCNAAAAVLDSRATLFNTFSMSAYPKIHEEIMNSKKYRSASEAQQHHQKMPPLGSLCQTVSQIGQSVSTKRDNETPMPSMSPVSLPSHTPNPLQNQQHPQHVASRDSGMESSDDTKSESGSTKDENGQLWPAWVYCTRYSDRPSSGPRYRRPKQPKDKTTPVNDEKRPRTAFSSEQLARLKREFNENRYLTERRRQSLSAELGLNEAQIKIWFQNKRAKIKKSTGQKNPLALQLMAQGLYNHTTVPLTKEEEELEMRMNGQLLQAGDGM